MNMDKTICLSDEGLEMVQGGSVDWKAFSNKFLDYVVKSKLSMEPEYKELIDLIKQKDWTSVASKALPLIAKDPEIAKLLYDCK